ncbi:MAG: hypothetical protein J5685_10065 [Clostridiales bacterium]|nr:hypothetical protein [Clostridiales bacterium]
MNNATAYRFLHSLRRRMLPMVLVLLGVAGGGYAVLSLDRIRITFHAPDTEAMLGLFSILSLICFDYAFAVGFRSGVLGYSLSDVVYCFAGPFGKKHNLFLSFTSGGASALFFLWLICANSPLMTMWIGARTIDVIGFLIGAFFTVLITFLGSSYLSARFCDNTKAKVIAVVSLLASNLILGLLVLKDLIGVFGSFEQVKQQDPALIVRLIGNSFYTDIFPIAGWDQIVYKEIVRGGIGIRSIIVIALYIIILLGIILLYIRSDFDFYEHAYDNASRIADIIEASKAGVEAVNTGIARTAKVGKEVYKRGWGATAFFHMHLFENIRASKIFFINKVALVYRVFALLLLLIADGMLEEIWDVLLVIVGIATMLVLNAIVFGGSKTVLEFNRPYIYTVPEKSGRKLMMCIFSDIPEMLFDALICLLIIKLVAREPFGPLAMISFLIMMVIFDLLSETAGILCAKLLRKFGKFALMGVRYVLIVFLIIIGMLPAEIFTNLVTGAAADNIDIILCVMIASMAGVYFLLWLAVLSLTRVVFERTDANDIL